MIIIEDLNSFFDLKNPVITVGSFDGVHCGHKKILKKLKEKALKIGGTATVLTFEPHPRIFLSPKDDTIKLINTKEEKLKRLEEFGVDAVIIIPFDNNFSKLSSVEFIENILVDKLGVKAIVTGYDHHFGKNREGGITELTNLSGKHGFEIDQISEEDINDIAISSTRIRKALKTGEIELANCLLGYNYSVMGEVIHGNKFGRTMGFPTANFKPDDNYTLIQCHGVYAVKTEIEGCLYEGMCNIGIRPTLNLSELTYEVNIFNFDNDIYGKYIKVIFYKKIRDEIKFSSIESLKKQLSKDRDYVKEYFNCMI